MTDSLVRQLLASTKVPFELFLLDNGSEPEEVSKFTTHRLETNIGLNGGTDFLWNLVREDPQFEFFWFLCNDLRLDGRSDYLESLIRTFDDAASKYKVAAVSPTYIPDSTRTQPPMMVSRSCNGWRPVVYLEWNAVLIGRDFMNQFFPLGFQLPTRHAMQDVVVTFEAWNNGWACLVDDALTLEHIENQTFLQHGGKTVNGVFVPNYDGLNQMLEDDFARVSEQYSINGVDLVATREEQHRDIDLRGDWKKYLRGYRARPPGVIVRLGRKAIGLTKRTSQTSRSGGGS